MWTLYHEVLLTQKIWHQELSRNMTNTTKWPVSPAKTQISLADQGCPGWSVSSLSASQKRKMWAALWQSQEKWHVRPAKTQISLGIRPVWLVFAVRMKKAWVLSYPLSAQRRLWLDWEEAQADLSLRWAHSYFVGFVVMRLINKERYLKLLLFLLLLQSLLLLLYLFLLLLLLQLLLL